VWVVACRKCMERETGIEPATNSLGSCDSTTELLPLSSVDVKSVTPLQNHPQFVRTAIPHAWLSSPRLPPCASCKIPELFVKENSTVTELVLGRPWFGQRLVLTLPPAAL
jgi:hypothetical protein